MIEFKIPAMSCGHCVSVITKTAQAADPGAQVQVDLPHHTVTVETSLKPGVPGSGPGQCRLRASMSWCR